MQSVRTLLIDDDRFALAFLAHQLGLQGFDRIQACPRAEEALLLLEGAAEGRDGAEPIGLVLCNLQMPEIDGIEMVRHLARIGYAGSLILIGADHPRVLQAAEQLASARQLRVLGCLGKPLSAHSLRRLIERHGVAQPLPGSGIEQQYDAKRLCQAIKDNELLLHYQPLVAMHSGDVVGVEALVRWQHPRDGLVVPLRFVPLAEESGLMDVMTRQVLAMALAQARKWQDTGLQLSVSVNVSMDDLVSLDFPDLVVEMAERAGVSPSTLVLEVTESRLMEAPLATLDILTRLRLKRVGLAIDDFGSGYSSLKQLRDLPFDELKIDRRFISGAHADSALRGIVEATLRMANQFGLRSVAEGVEDQADWDYLCSVGCDVAQGYQIARAMPAGEVAAWVRNFQQRRTAVA
jgi:EAL domain-containing protein (putative c-di-GMP-specific phosphodiesterase class I)